MIQTTLDEFTKSTSPIAMTISAAPHPEDQILAILKVRKQMLKSDLPKQLRRNREWFRSLINQNKIDMFYLKIDKTSRPVLVLKV